MKKIILAFFVLSAMTLPSVSRATIITGVPFGGLDVYLLPATCSIPTFVPTPCQTVPLPPAFTFHFFVMLFVANAPITASWLAVPIGMPITFPTPHQLFPGEWALGFEIPTPTVGGWFVPSYPEPWGCFPPTSLCLPMTVPPAIGIIEPLTGAAPGGFF